MAGNQRRDTSVAAVDAGVAWTDSLKSSPRLAARPAVLRTINVFGPVRRSDARSAGALMQCGMQLCAWSAICVKMTRIADLVKEVGECRVGFQACGTCDVLHRQPLTRPEPMCIVNVVWPRREHSPRVSWQKIAQPESSTFDVAEVRDAPDDPPIAIRR